MYQVEDETGHPHGRNPTMYQIESSAVSAGLQDYTVRSISGAYPPSVRRDATP
jgi:hypothetical protein